MKCIQESRHRLPTTAPATRLQLGRNIAGHESHSLAQTYQTNSQAKGLDDRAAIKMQQSAVRL